MNILAYDTCIGNNYCIGSAGCQNLQHKPEQLIKAVNRPAILYEILILEILQIL